MNLAWTKLKEEPYNCGWRRMLKKTFRLLNNKEVDYDIKDEGKTCCALVITSDQRVILVKVFRPGPEKILMEMPGGWIEENEDSKTAIIREVKEELGYQGDTEFVGTNLVDAYSNCIRHTFVIKNAKKVQEPQWEEDEECEIISLTLSQFRDHLRSGELTDVEAGYRALDYLKLL